MLTPIVPSSWTAEKPESSRRSSGTRRTGSGSGASPLTRSTRDGRSIRSAPPANRLVSFCQARVPGASVTTIPATRPNQSKPPTALATSRAIARLQPPEK